MREIRDPRIGSLFELGAVEPSARFFLGRARDRQSAVAGRWAEAGGSPQIERKQDVGIKVAQAPQMEAVNEAAPTEYQVDVAVGDTPSEVALRKRSRLFNRRRLLFSSVWVVVLG